MRSLLYEMNEINKVGEEKKASAIIPLLKILSLFLTQSISHLMSDIRKISDVFYLFHRRERKHHFLLGI